MISLLNKNYRQYKNKYPDKPKRPDIKVGIADSKTGKAVDINDDGCPDYPHGKAVCDILMSGLKFVPIPVFYDTGLNNDNQSIQVRQQLKAISDFAKDKRVNYGVSSIGAPTYYNPKQMEESNRDELREKLFEGYMNNTKDMITASRYSPPEECSEFIHQYDLLNTLKKIGSGEKKLFMAAGNYTHEFISRECLAPGIITVGAINKQYKPRKFSAKNPMIDFYAKGSYKILPHYDKNGSVKGYDITEDGAIDVPLKDITGHEIIENFVGKDLSKIKAEEKDYIALEKLIKKDKSDKDAAMCNAIDKVAMLGAYNPNEEPIMPVKLKDLPRVAKSLNKKLYEIDKLEQYGIDVSARKKKLKRMGTHIDLVSLVNVAKDVSVLDAPTIVFKVKDEKVIYSPHKNTKIAGYMHGSSHAAPTALAQVMNEKYGY